jgi:hypothetical protein
MEIVVQSIATMMADGAAAATAAAERRSSAAAAAERHDDPLHKVNRLSWPITATLHTDLNPKHKHKLRTSSSNVKTKRNALPPAVNRVLVLGDQHQSLRGTCKEPACKEPACMTINQLVHGLVDWSLANGKHLDVFTEMQLVDDHAPRAKLLHAFEQGYGRRVGKWSARVRQRLLEWVKLDSIFGRHPGYIVEFVYEFRRQFLQPPPELVNKGIRFHYADARVNSLLRGFGADLRGIIFGGRPADRTEAVRTFYATYASVKQIDDLMYALCFSKKLSKDVAKIGVRFQGGGAIKTPRSASADDQKRARTVAKPIKHPLIKDDTYKVAKQVAKLQAADRTLLQAFYKKELCNPSALGPSRELDAELKRHAQDPESPEARQFAIVLLLHKTLALMDVYLLARMVYYMRKQEPGSTTVIYAGDAHADNYRVFLTQYMRMSARACHVRTPGDRMSLFSTKRCVNMTKCRLGDEPQRHAEKSPQSMQGKKKKET